MAGDKTSLGEIYLLRDLCKKEITREVTQTETFCAPDQLKSWPKEFFIKSASGDCTVLHVFHLMCFINIYYKYKCVDNSFKFELILYAFDLTNARVCGNGWVQFTDPTVCVNPA